MLKFDIYFFKTLWACQIVYLNSYLWFFLKNIYDIQFLTHFIISSSEIIKSRYNIQYHEN